MYKTTALKLLTAAAVSLSFILSPVATAQDDVPAWARDPKKTEADKGKQPEKTTDKKAAEKTKKDSASKKDDKKKEADKKKEDDKKKPAKKEEPKKEVKKKSEGKKKEAKKKDKKEPEDTGDKADWQKGTIYEGRRAVSPSSVISEYNHIGIFIGPFLLRDRAFLTINPNWDMHWWENGLSTGIHVPLNLQLVDASEPVSPYKPEKQVTEGLFRPRKEDWDEIPRDLMKIIRYIKYGNKDDKIYFNLGSLQAYSIGHGTVVRRYVNSADFDHKRLGLQFDLAIQKDRLDDYAGFQLFISDVTFGSQVFGFLVFGKPLVMMDSEIARSFSIGFHGTFDTNAPYHVVRDEDYYFLPTVNDKHSILEFDKGTVMAFGLDAVIKVVRTSNADVKPYLDFTYLMSKIPDKYADVGKAPAGTGTTFGLLNRFRFGEDTRMFMRLRGAGKLLTGSYLPAYFNTFYEIQKFQFFSGKNDLGICSAYDKNGACIARGAPTKLEFMQRHVSGARFGYELEWGFDVDGWFGIGAIFEGATPDPEGKNFTLYMAFTLMSYLSLHGTYHKTNIGNVLANDAGGFFDFKSDDHLLLSVLRLKIVNFLFLRAYYSRMWLLENRKFVDAYGFYKVVNMAGFGIELGYDWKPHGSDSEK